MVHPCGFVNSVWDPNGAPFGFCEFVVGPQWCALGVLGIRGGIPMVHSWGFVYSLWDPNGAPLGFVNSLWDPNGALLGFCEFAVGPQWCTIGVL